MQARFFGYDRSSVLVLTQRKCYELGMGKRWRDIELTDIVLLPHSCEKWPVILNWQAVARPSRFGRRLGFFLKPADKPWVKLLGVNIGTDMEGLQSNHTCCFPSILAIRKATCTGFQFWTADAACSLICTLSEVIGRDFRPYLSLYSTVWHFEQSYCPLVLVGHKKVQ